MVLVSENYFSDYDAYTEKEILHIDEKGISLKNGAFIDFSVCTENFHRFHSNISVRCVGERDITDFSFTFYALPKPIMIIFLKKGKLVEFFSYKNTILRFHELQRKIESCGYRTYDMS